MRTTILLLHGLAGSARIWGPVVDRLASWRCLCIDLPGFGDHAGAAGRSVLAMADHVAAAVRAEISERWILVGHSMGAKVAAVVARRSEDGEAGLGGLDGLVMLAGSPPGSEPMDDETRATMLEWFGGSPERSRAEASGFIAANIGDALDAATHEHASGEVLRADRQAWRDWLETGSREDWSLRVGRLRTRALLVAGAEDGPLGADYQGRTAEAHYADARIIVVPGVGHMLPIECPGEVARLIAEHARSTPDCSFGDLLHTGRVSARTREVVLARAAPMAARSQSVLTEAQLGLLRAVLDRVLPQPEGEPIDLALRIDAQLASEGDGWRFALLPPDAVAYRSALDTLDGAGFGRLDATGQDALLQRIAQGAFEAHGPLTDAQMTLWFEEVRADATRIYMSHPSTLARIGYSGLAQGGDGPRKSGFILTGLGERDCWEPVAAGASREA